MKSFQKTIFIAYLTILSWLVLFKFSYDILSVIATFHTRSLNLVPFVASSKRDMLENLIVFIPFGLLLSTNCKRITLWHKLAVIFTYSFAIELIQFVLAIGRTDITDIITNTVGGLLGLALYELGKKYIDNEKLDRLIGVIIAILLIIVIALRTLILRVKY